MFTSIESLLTQNRKDAVDGHDDEEDAKRITVAIGHQNPSNLADPTIPDQTIPDQTVPDQTIPAPTSSPPRGQQDAGNLLFGTAATTTMTTYDPSILAAWELWASAAVSAAVSRLRRPRTAFSLAQVQALERTFQEDRYVSRPRRSELSHELHLSEAQIKIWFQNRRMKQKKADCERCCGGTTSSTSTENQATDDQEEDPSQ